MLKNLTFGLLFFALGVSAWSQTGDDVLRRTEEGFFRTAEARRVGAQVLLYQRVTGGWPKNIDMTQPLNVAMRAEVLRERTRRDDSTTDNGATTRQMTYLARLYQALQSDCAEIGDAAGKVGAVDDSCMMMSASKLRDRCKDAFQRAVAYLLSGQYANGGWPQFWPENQGYHEHITYNDDAMVNTLRILRDIAEQREPYGNGLTSDSLRQCALTAFKKGIDCILATQICINGEPTVWCQQHDRETLLPAGARSYELPSFCSAESAGIVRLLMELPSPDSRVCTAIHGAMRWFAAHQITGYRYERASVIADPASPEPSHTIDARLVADSTAAPLWARFYDLQRGEPFVCDRDGIPCHRLEDLGTERRNGYAWYTTRPSSLFPLYEQWRERNR